MASTTVDKTTGKIYLGEFGLNSNFKVNQILEKMKFDSLEKWDDIFNCAEIRAVSKAIDDRSRIGDLVVTTIRVSKLSMAPMCNNCQKLLQGVYLVVSG